MHSASSCVPPVHPGPANAVLTGGLRCSYERFLWAVGTVRARTHAPLDGAASALVPLADLVGPRQMVFCAVAVSLFRACG